jgi:hypothetical protein
MTRPDKKILTRVELTYADGSRYALRDEDARAWESASNACVLSAYTRGARMRRCDWEEVPPDAERERREAELADLQVRMRAAFQILSGAHKEVHRDCDICDALRFLSDEKSARLREGTP